MFDFSKYEVEALKRIKKAAETLLYYGYGDLHDMARAIGVVLKKREGGR